MPINFDKALGNHEQALYLQARRMDLLASNIANADTPGYKAQDIDFKGMLGEAQNGYLNMQVTSAGHIPAFGSTLQNTEAQYRIPSQSSLDGNSVELEVEKAEFAENSVRYQTTLRFLSGRFKGLMGALKGE